MPRARHTIRVYRFRLWLRPKRANTLAKVRTTARARAVARPLRAAQAKTPAKEKEVAGLTAAPCPACQRKSKPRVPGERAVGIRLRRRALVFSPALPAKAEQLKLTHIREKA